MIEPELPHSPVRRYVSAPCPGSPTKKSDPKNPECEEVSEKSGSSSGDNGFRGLLKGRFRANDALGEKECSVGRQWVYIFNRRSA